MIFDSVTIAVLATELTARHQGKRVRSACADTSGLDLLLESGADSQPMKLRLSYGPPGALNLAPVERLQVGDGPVRYLQDACIESISAVPQDRVLTLRLSRPDAVSKLSYGLLHLSFIPPRYRAVLVSEGHGRILGVWAAASDRQAPAHGAQYAPPQSAPNRCVPRRDSLENFRQQLQQQQGSLQEGMRHIVTGADRHLMACACAGAGISADTSISLLETDQITTLWKNIQRLWSATGEPTYRWQNGPTRVSVAPPEHLSQTLDVFPSVYDALQVIDEMVDDSTARSADQRRRMKKVLGVLQRRAQGLQLDLDAATDAGELERKGHSLLAMPHRITPGGRGYVSDAHGAQGMQIEIQLAPGQTAAEHAAQLLKRVAKLRRRADVLPPRLHRVQELIFETERLLQRIHGEDDITEDEMARWERRVEVRQAPEAGDAGSRRGDERKGARPRRYVTSAGWSVWAGRNNQENDIVSHRLAAQNDLWFHAHGYSGSHVILRREGRKQEPSIQSIEEAAAVAAHWSKGRTANKVPVVYTLAKYVSKPKGGAPGLAVMKREKTIMVRPALLDEEEGS